MHPNQAGMRLDQVLKVKMRYRSRSKIQQLIEARDVTVGGVRADRSFRVKAFDEIRVPLPPPPEDASRIGEIPLDILYEDDVLIVLNKQPGIVVHPSGSHLYDTLINALHLRYRNLEDPEKDIVPKLAHRLDRETSGVLVACKTARHERGTPVVFENADVRKEYLAIAEGVIEKDSGMIELPVGKEPDKYPHTALMVVRSDGLPARTGYQVLERFSAFTLVRCRLFTGRQHQIRVHLQALDHPVVCDKFYGRREELRLSDIRALRRGEQDIVLMDRQALHSCRLSFSHPVSGEELTVEAPLPDDMKRTLEALRAT